MGARGRRGLGHMRLDGIPVLPVQFTLPLQAFAIQGVPRGGVVRLECKPMWQWRFRKQPRAFVVVVPEGETRKRTSKRLGTA